MSAHAGEALAECRRQLATHAHFARNRESALAACRGELAECGEALAACGEALAACGEALAACRGELAECGEALAAPSVRWFRRQALGGWAPVACAAAFLSSVTA